MKELILIRGLPGSGKSTFARSINWVTASPVHIEADFFFCSMFDQPTGPKAAYDYDFYDTGNRDEFSYRFVPEKVSEAHTWCQEATRFWLKKGRSVVVSNTFTRRWEMQPYFDLAEKYGAQVTVIKCEGNYGNVHGVPDDVIKKMKDRWEEYV